MYARILILLVCLISFSGILHAKEISISEDSTEKKHHLDIKGRIIIGKRKPLAKTWVKVFADSTGNIVQKMESDNEGYVALQLPIEKSYTMKISKSGYVTKIVTIDTHMPRSQMGDYYFEFTMDLFESIEGVDVSMLRDPVAKIFFNSFTKNFDYDANYTAIINNNLKKLYANYELQKKQGKVQVFTNTNTENETLEKAAVDTAKTAVIKAPSGPKTSYSVEVLSSAEQIQRNSPRFKGMVNIKEYQENGMYRYYVGDYPTLKDAEKMKDNITGFFPGASIISFLDGKKINSEVVDVPHDK